MRKEKSSDIHWIKAGLAKLWHAESLPRHTAFTDGSFLLISFAADQRL
jgi:hypothetical protein